MTAAAQNIAIESRFSANFTAYPVKYENVDYDPTPGQAWVELLIEDTTVQRASVGTEDEALVRARGLISANIYLPQNTGTATGRAIADAIATIFRDVQFSGITCRQPVIKNIGSPMRSTTQEPKESWFVVNVTTPFYRDEVFS
jgi:hypothetical protein